MSVVLSRVPIDVKDIVGQKRAVQSASGALSIIYEGGAFTDSQVLKSAVQIENFAKKLEKLTGNSIAGSTNPSIKEGVDDARSLELRANIARGYIERVYTKIFQQYEALSKKAEQEGVYFNRLSVIREIDTNTGEYVSELSAEKLRGALVHASSTLYSKGVELLEKETNDPLLKRFKEGWNKEFNRRFGSGDAEIDMASVLSVHKGRTEQILSMDLGTVRNPGTMREFASSDTIWLSNWASNIEDRLESYASSKGWGPGSTVKAFRDEIDQWNIQDLSKFIEELDKAGFHGFQIISNDEMPVDDKELFYLTEALQRRRKLGQTINSMYDTTDRGDRVLRPSFK